MSTQISVFPNTNNGTHAVVRLSSSNLWRLCWAIPLLALVWLLTGCETSSPKGRLAPALNTSPLGAKSATSMRLQEGDVLHITSEGATNVNATVKVQLDGNIVLPLMGEVKVLGKTLLEVQADLNKLYARVLQPGYQITVSLVNASACIYVSGAVIKPGRIPMERPMTLLEAIMEAGGFDPNRAKPSQVMVFRVENGLQYHLKFDLKKTLKGQDSGVFYLKPFDIVHVPEKTFNF